MNSYEYQDAVLASNLSANAKLTALAISYHYNWKEAKASFPSNKLISDRTSLSTRSVIRAKNELVAAGFLKSARRFNKSNTYVPVSPTPCHTVTWGVSDWQPNNEYNYEVNNELRGSDEPLQLNNNIKAEEIWKVYENEKRDNPAHAAGRSNKNIRRSNKETGRSNPDSAEVARFLQDLADSRKADWVG